MKYIFTKSKKYIFTKSKKYIFTKSKTYAETIYFNRLIAKDTDTIFVLLVDTYYTQISRLKNYFDFHLKTFRSWHNCIKPTITVSDIITVVKEQFFNSTSHLDIYKNCHLDYLQANQSTYSTIRCFDVKTNNTTLTMQEKNLCFFPPCHNNIRFFLYNNKRKSCIAHTSFRSFFLIKTLMINHTIVLKAIKYKYAKLNVFTNQPHKLLSPIQIIIEYLNKSFYNIHMPNEILYTSI